MPAIEHAQKLINNAQAAAGKAQQDANTLAAFAPYIPGEPKYFFVSELYSSKVRACYKVRTIAEMLVLLSKLPPVDRAACQGTFASVIPRDVVRDKDCTRRREDCDGVTVKVEQSATTGSYPCDQHPMSVEWYCDTPAGRVSVKVEFNFNISPEWPRLWVQYEKRYDMHGRETGENVRLHSWGCHQSPSAGFFRYGSGEPHKAPGHYLFWFADADARNAAFNAMEPQA